MFSLDSQRPAPSRDLQGSTRVLTAMEEVAWMASFAAPINAAVVMHVSGPTTVEAWQRALEAVQRRHPLLSASIERPGRDTSGHPAFHIGAGSPVPLRLVPLQQVPRWEGLLEAELAHRFAWGEQPLMRATLLHASDRCILMLCANHAIVDGISYMHLARDLLHAVTGKALEPLPVARSTEDLLGLTPMQRSAEPVPPSPEEHPQDLGSSVRTTIIEPGPLENWLEACRRHDCTFNGALVLASTEALRLCSPRFQDRPIRVLTPVNARPLLGVGEDCGICVATPHLSVDPGETATFWDRARQVVHDLQQGSTREAVLANTEHLRDLLHGGASNRLAETTATDPGREMIVTNLGRFPHRTTVGPLTLEALFPAVPNTLPPFQTIAAATVAGRLCLTWCSRDPRADMLQTVVAILDDVCCR